MTLAGDVLAQDGELVAAQARHGVPRAQDALQPAGDGAQQLVARGVAEGVVDGLEAIEVEEEDRDAARVAAEARHRLPEAVEEELAVRQPGQIVVEGLVRESGLDALALDGERHGAAQTALV